MLAVFLQVVALVGPVIAVVGVFVLGLVRRRRSAQVLTLDEDTLTLAGEAIPLGVIRGLSVVGSHLHIDLPGEPRRVELPNWCPLDRTRLLGSLEAQRLGLKVFEDEGEDWAVRVHHLETPACGEIRGMAWGFAASSFVPVLIWFLFGSYGVSSAVWVMLCVVSWLWTSAAFGLALLFAGIWFLAEPEALAFQVMQGELSIRAVHLQGWGRVVWRSRLVDTDVELGDGKILLCQGTRERTISTTEAVADAFWILRQRDESLPSDRKAPLSG